MSSADSRTPPNSRDQWGQYLDGTLSAEDVARLNGQLQTDASLRREFAELLLLQVHLGELGRELSAACLVAEPGMESRQSSRAKPPLPGKRMGESPLFGKADRRRSVVRWSMALAASVVLCFGLKIWLLPSVNNTPAVAVAPGTSVTLERGGQAITVSGRVVLVAGDVLRTGGTTGSNAVTLTYGSERTRVSLFAGSDLKISDWGRGKQFELREGKVEASVARQRPLRPMLVRTPQAEARVLGTEFTLTTTTNATRLEVAEGEVRLTRTIDGARADVPAQHYAIAAANVHLESLPKPGRILREYWTNILGDSPGPTREGTRVSRSAQRFGTAHELRGSLRLGRPFW